MVSRREIVAARPELAGLWSAVDALFPVRVTRSFWARVDLTDPADPLARQVLPGPAELEPHPGDDDDPVGEQGRSPVPWVVHKYPDRVLLIATKRCHLYCRYCFRRTHKPEERLDPGPEAWQAAIGYARASGASEAILSGGDPLILTDAALDATATALRAEGSGIRRLRLHTRAPITFPERVTPALVALLAAHQPWWVVVHCNHPRELSPDVDAALARLVDAGIQVMNQTVLLRGVNDDPGVLAELCEALVARRVRPYYLHATDEVTGNADFRVPLDEGLRIWRALRARVAGPMVPRFVIDPPDGSGKIDVADWLDGRRRDQV